MEGADRNEEIGMTGVRAGALVATTDSQDNRSRLQPPTSPPAGRLPRPSPRWGWAGLADSDTSVALGMGWIGAAAIFAWAPVIAGVEGFTAAAELAAIPVAVVLGFSVQAQGQLASELVEAAQPARGRKGWQALMTAQGHTAIAALLALVTYAAVTAAADGGGEHWAARVLAPIVAVLVVLAVGVTARLPETVRRVKARPTGSHEGNPANTRRRVVAGLVDMVLQSALSGLIMLGAFLAGWIRETTVTTWVVVVFAVVRGCYEWIAVAAGGSVGMRMGSLRVADAPGRRRRYRVLRCGVRAAVSIGWYAIVGCVLLMVWRHRPLSGGDPAVAVALSLSLLFAGLLSSHPRGQSVRDLAAGMTVDADPTVMQTHTTASQRDLSPG